MSKKNDDRLFEVNTFSAEGLRLVRVDKKSKEDAPTTQNPRAGKRTKKEIVERLIDFVENEME